MKSLNYLEFCGTNVFSQLHNLQTRKANNGVGKKVVTIDGSELKGGVIVICPPFLLLYFTLNII
ncbi:MAG: hypothetical protein ACJAUH_002523 [Saprospiraceae bacterium]|jgi:hypothetical protein